MQLCLLLCLLTREALQDYRDWVSLGQLTSVLICNAGLCHWITRHLPPHPRRPPRSPARLPSSSLAPGQLQQLPCPLRPALALLDPSLKAFELYQYLQSHQSLPQTRYEPQCSFEVRMALWYWATFYLCKLCTKGALAV